ncbi:MAG: glutamyl-tRNA reductase, partial [Candidatus Melainabacteria bacterium]|nr:glutamyl-tRNA reductase [Candidatus Melainabacteria bacterium]
LLVCGLNYHSTPLAIRERFAIPETCLKHALKALGDLPHVEEAVLLSTCNRIEAYALVSDIYAGLQELESFFLSVQKIPDHQILKPNFKLLRDDVVLHLLRVASGLDSMVVGEGHIMSQIKGALNAALAAGTAGQVLSELFKLALNCGKRVRSATSMSRRAVSIGTAAIELARNVLGSLQNKTVVVIGAGKMAQLCIKHMLNEISAGTLWWLNRTPDRMTRFCQINHLQGKNIHCVTSFAERHKLVSEADLVIVATSASYHLITESELAKQNISGKPLIIDISVPRNVDPSLIGLSSVQLYDIDALATIVQENLRAREALITEVEVIVQETLDRYHSWQRSLLVVPTINKLREKIEAIRLEQMATKRTCIGILPEGSSCLKIEEISKAIINQILHHPTTRLKATRDVQRLLQHSDALELLFDLHGTAMR